MRADALRDKRPHRLGLPLLVVGGLVALEAIVALSATRRLAPIAAGIMVGAGLLYVILRRPGVVPYIALGWLVFEKAAESHFALPQTTINALGNDLLVVALSWTLLVNLLRRRAPLFTMRQIGPPLLAFLGLGVASAVVNDVPVHIAALGILSPTHSLLIFLSLVNIGVEARDVSRFVYIAVAIMALIGLVAVLQAVPGSPAWHLAARQPPDSTDGGYVRVPGIFEDAISLGDFLALVMPLGLMLLFFGTGRGRQRTFLLLANLVMLLALLLTFTRGAWGGVLIGALVLGLTVERKLWWATLKYVLPGVVALGLLFEPIVSRLRETAQGNLRFTLFQDTLPLIRDHLWFGAGPGRFGGHIALITDSPLYAQYHFPAFAYATGGQVDMFWTHTVAESGLLGTAAYLAIIGTCFVVGRRAYRRAVTPARKAHLLGLLYVIPVTVFVSLFSSVLEAGPPATLFWALMGLLTVLANTPDGPSVSGGPDQGDERDRASCDSELPAPLDNRLDAAEVVRAIRCSRGLSRGDLLAPAELLATLRRNKVPLLSLALPAAYSAPHEVRVLLDSTEFGTALRVEQARCAEAHGEYVRLVQDWAQQRIPNLCITSVGIAPSFPYTSDHVDLLVPAEQVRDARRVLLDLSYVEMTNAEEPLGWLFCCFVGGRTVSLIHLHAHVAIARSAIGFLLEEELWRRAQQAPDDPWVQVPGREDAVLITLAHALLSGKARSELSLHDLLKVRHVLGDGSLDWAYLERVAHERGWEDCLALGLLVVAQLEEQLFAHGCIPAAQRERCARTLSWWGGRYRERLRGHSPTLPFRISFVASKLLFFAKLWRDRHLEASRKPAQTVLALAHGLTRRSGLHLQNSMLLALSGVDGGGKSTQACALRDAFEAGHVRSRIVWARIGDTPLLRLLHSARKRFEQSKGALTQRTFSRTGWRLVLWAIVASGDYAAWLQYVRWRLWRGDVVIADRYLCDFEVELGIRLRNEPHLAALLLRVLRSLAPTPKRAYLLQIDPALSRNRTTESDFSDLDPADMQRRYDALIHRYGLRACDASRPLDDLAAELVHDALTTYMANVQQRVRARFVSNPRQPKPGDWRIE